MGNTVRIRLYGTEAEIKETVKALPSHASDRIHQLGAMWQHMNAHLGFEAWAVCLVKRYLSDQTLETLHKQSEKYPKMVYRVTDVQEKLIGEGWTYTNFKYDDEQYPGPFGALCRAYGLPYYDRVLVNGSAAILCNQCYRPLTGPELDVYPLQWQHSGDMYCFNCRDCPDDCRRHPCRLKEVKLVEHNGWPFLVMKG